jgi:drug/metabolite transporter (DMT)-like permease
LTRLTTNDAQPAADVRSVSPAGGFFLVLVCFLWGVNVVSIRISNQGVPPILAAAFRSACGAGLVWLYARARGYPTSLPREETLHGMVIGVLFALDFLFFYWGLAFTTASRSIIFLYTYPFWVAIGAHFWLRGDRLTALRSAGLVLAFCGILAVFTARSSDLPPRHWIGDLMELGAGVFWGATTLYIKRMVQRRPITHYQTLYAQLLYSIPVLGFCSLLFERSSSIDLAGLVPWALAYQVIGVAFFSYVLWFWMIGQYPVSSLTAFTFLAPLFGVFLGSFALSEPVPPLAWLGLGMVGAGIYLVNRQ